MIKLLINNNKIEIILGLIIAVYIVLFSYLSIHRLYALNSYYYDLGIMHQVVYNTSQGRFLEMTNQDFAKNMSRLAIHFDPILALLAPFYKIWNGPETLLIIQTIVLGAGAWAVFLIANKILKNKLVSLVFATSYLLYFPVERANLFDFHAVALATMFLLFMIYFALEKKYWLSFIFIFLSFLTKEHVGLVIFLFGLHLLFKREKKFSLLIMFLGLGFFITTVAVIIPYFRQGAHFALSYFNNFNQIFTKETIEYLGKLLLSHGIFIVFSPLEFLIALPEMAINIVSTNDNMRNIYFHYNSLIVPFIMFAAICGFKKIRQKKLFLTLFIILNLISIYFYNPLPISFLKEPYWWGKINDEKIAFIKKWNNNLGENIKIASTPKIAPFLTGRQFFYDFLFDPTYSNMRKSDSDIISKIDQYNLADYVIINKEEVKTNIPKKFYENLLNNKAFEKIEEKEGVEVYKKSSIINNQ